MKRNADQLAQLAEAIRRLEGAPPANPAPSADPAPSANPANPAAPASADPAGARADRRSWAAGPEAVGGRPGLWPPALARRGGCVHEWFAGAGEAAGCDGAADPVGPPLCVLADLAGRALEPAAGAAGGRWCVWVGRWCWPHPPMGLGAGASAWAGAWARSLFVEASAMDVRLWAGDIAARCPAVGVVVLDGRGLGMAGTRRLQLAAQANGALVLLARAWSERGALSAAAMRWHVTPRATACDRPRWRIALRRCKGVQRRDDTDVSRTGVSTWEVEWDCAQGRLVTSTDVADRAAVSTARVTGRRRPA